MHQTNKRNNHHMTERPCVPIYPCLHQNALQIAKWNSYVSKLITVLHACELMPAREKAEEKMRLLLIECMCVLRKV